MSTVLHAGTLPPEGEYCEADHQSKDENGSVENPTGLEHEELLCLVA
ncbi:hypothetical protein [Hoeflea sp.]